MSAPIVNTASNQLPSDVTTTARKIVRSARLLHQAMLRDGVKIFGTTGFSNSCPDGTKLALRDLCDRVEELEALFFTINFPLTEEEVLKGFVANLPHADPKPEA